MRVGIIGSGNIASQMAATINQVDGVELYAVASRTVAKAKDFAEKFGASCYYGNYEDLANDRSMRDKLNGNLAKYFFIFA